MIVVTVARKPLAAPTVAANVLTHGVGALNIDGARIAPVEGEELRRNAVAGDYLGSNTFRIRDRRVEDKPAGMGRWPSNVILEHKEGCATDACTPGCPVAELDQQSGESKSSGFGGRTIVKRATAAERDGNRGPAYGAESRPEGAVMTSYDDVGGASRFFKQVGGRSEPLLLSPPASPVPTALPQESSVLPGMPSSVCTVPVFAVDSDE